ANAIAIDAASHARWTARFSAANESAEEDAVFALAAVLTRGARIPKLPDLRAASRNAGPDGDAKVVEALLDTVSRARFGPAQGEGVPPAPNLLWLVTHET